MNIGTVRLIVIFFLTMLVFTFFSRVLYIHNLPEVIIGRAVGSYIRRHHRASGIVKISENYEVIANKTGRITLHAREGDMIRVGQLIYSIEIDLSNLEEQMITLKHNRDAQNLQVQRIHNDIFHRREAAPQSPVNLPLNLLDYDLEIDMINARIETEEEELDRLHTLYGLGAVPASDIYRIQREIASINDLLSAAINRRQNVIERHEGDIARSEEDYAQARADNARLIADLEFQLRAAQLYLAFTNAEILRLEDWLAVGGIYEYLSAFSGEIIQINDMARGGRNVAENTMVMTILPDNAEMHAVFSLPHSVDFIELGQNVGLNIRSRRNIAGKVVNIRFFHSHFDVYVSFESNDIQIGERAEAIFENISTLYSRTLPNSAIREAWWQDNVYFVYAIERERGLFRYIYSVQRQAAVILKEGPSRTAVQDAFPGDIDIVIGSSQAISQGMRVRVVQRLSR